MPNPSITYNTTRDVFQVDGDASNTVVSCNSGDLQPLVSYNGTGSGSLSGPYGTFASSCYGDEVYWGGYNPNQLMNGKIWTSLDFHMNESPTITHGPDKEILKFAVLYTLTDTNCCTCDTVVYFEVERDFEIYPPYDPILPVTIEMENETEGTLSFRCPSGPQGMNDSLNIFPFDFSDLDGGSKKDTTKPKIMSMIHTESGREATIEDNIATIDFSDAPLVLDTVRHNFWLTFDNPHHVKMFKGKVGLITHHTNEQGIRELNRSDFIVTAQVPTDDSPDLIKQSPLPADMNIMPFVAELTNNNPYQSDITTFSIRTDSPDFEILMIGKLKMLDSIDGPVFIEFLSDGNDLTYYRSSDELTESYILSGSKKFSLAPGETADDIFIALSFADEMIGEQVPIFYETFER